MTTTPPPSPTPAEIRRARDVAGLTQTQSARLLYVSDRGWQAWERGERRMPPAMLELYVLKSNMLKTINTVGA